MNAPPVSRARFFPLVIFLGIGVMMASCFMFSFKSRSGQKMTRDEAPFSDLPADASSISYFIPGLMGRDIYLEFDTSEDGFNGWIEEQENTELTKQADGEFRIDRFNFSTNKGQTISIADGVLYAWTEDAKGVYFGYDRGAGRAYFHSRAK